MRIVHHVGNGVIVECLRIEGAGELQHLGRLLAHLRRWNNGLFARRLVGQARTTFGNMPRMMVGGLR